LHTSEQLADCPTRVDGIPALKFKNTCKLHKPQKEQEMHKKLALFALLIASVGCNTITPKNPPAPSSKALGLLEVTLDFSDETHPTSTTHFMPLDFGQNGISSRAITAIGNETSQIALKRNSVSFIDANESFGTQTRYVHGTFEIANFSPRAFNNLSFMGISLNTQLGTMFSALADGAGVTIPATDTLPDSQLTYRALKPSHGMRSSASNGVEVEPDAADLQIFTSAEANTVQTAVSPTYPGIQVLEYGFTARSNTGNTSRSIPVTPISASCSSTLTTPPNGYTLVATDESCFKGRVTFAFKFPLPFQNRHRARGGRRQWFLTNQILCSVVEVLKRRCTFMRQPEPNRTSRVCDQ
jgi:hypothetical protein